jgi:hypothetical protein
MKQSVGDKLSLVILSFIVEIAMQWRYIYRRKGFCNKSRIKIFRMIYSFIPHCIVGWVSITIDWESHPSFIHPPLPWSLSTVPSFRVQSKKIYDISQATKRRWRTSQLISLCITYYFNDDARRICRPSKNVANLQLIRFYMPKAETAGNIHRKDLE